MATTSIKYTGPFAEGVEIETGQWAEPNKPLEVEAALAKRLLQQSVWEPADTKKGSK